MGEGESETRNAHAVPQRCRRVKPVVKKPLQALTCLPAWCRAGPRRAAPGTLTAPRCPRPAPQRQAETHTALFWAAD